MVLDAHDEREAWNNFHAAKFRFFINFRVSLEFLSSELHSRMRELKAAIRSICLKSHRTIHWKRDYLGSLEAFDTISKKEFKSISSWSNQKRAKTVQNTRRIKSAKKKSELKIKFILDSVCRAKRVCLSVRLCVCWFLNFLYSPASSRKLEAYFSFTLMFNVLFCYAENAFFVRHRSPSWA